MPTRPTSALVLYAGALLLVCIWAARGDALVAAFPIALIAHQIGDELYRRIRGARPDAEASTSRRRMVASAGGAVALAWWVWLSPSGLVIAALALCVVAVGLEIRARWPRAAAG